MIVPTAIFSVFTALFFGIAIRRAQQRWWSSVVTASMAGSFCLVIAIGYAVS